MKVKKMGLLSLITVFCVVMALFFANLIPVKAAQTKNNGEGTDFFHVSGDGAGATYDAVSNTQNVYINMGWGSRMELREKVSLSDFSMVFKFKGLPDGDKLGFGFMRESLGYWDPASNMVISPVVDTYDLGGGNVQVSYRLQVTHDSNGKKFTSEDGSEPARYVINGYSKVLECTVSFSSKLMTEGANAGKYEIKYNMEGQDLAMGTAGGTTFYLTEEELFGTGNTAQDVYVFFGGMQSATIFGVTITQLEDQYSKERLAAATADLAAYEALDGSDAAATLLARDTAMQKIANVSVMASKNLKERFAAHDVVLKENAAFVTEVKTELEAQIAAYETAVALLETEISITAGNITDAKAKKTAINTSLFELLAAADKDAYITRIDVCDYAVTKAEILIEILDFEAFAEACEQNKIPQNILDAEARAAQIKLISLDKLKEADKTALEERIQTINDRIAAVKEEIAAQFADYYVTQFEAFVSDINLEVVDIATVTFDMINQVIDAKTLIIFDETHADYASLKARLDAAEIIYKNSISTFYLAKIAEAKAILDDAAKASDLSEFSKAMAIYQQIDQAAIAGFEKETEMKEKLAEIDTVMKASKLNGFENTGMQYVKTTDRGISASGIGEYPNRLNFNEKVDMKDAKIVVSMDKYAYYNSETSGKGANNICINLLTSPSSYKGLHYGITIMIWVFETQCNVVIYNYNDTAITNVSLATPAEGSDIIIRVGLMSDMWIVKINEAEVVFGNNSLVGVDKDIFKDGENYFGYFSMGSFSNDKTDPNDFTVRQVGDHKFTNETFEFPDFNEEEPTPPVDGGDKEQPKEGLSGGAIAGIVCGSVAVAGGGGFAIYWFLIRKKKI